MKAKHCVWSLAFSMAAAVSVLAQEDVAHENPFRVTGDVDVSVETHSSHPDGDTPRERMLTLAHTDALPRFDRAELYALATRDPFSEEVRDRRNAKSTFPVRPYGKHVSVVGHATLKGAACDALGDAWRSLDFDRLGGAFCHQPVYGFRLYRDDVLLFETTVCWRCQNFYVPWYNLKENKHDHVWYGFANDQRAKSLLALFKSHLPHPKL